MRNYINLIEQKNLEITNLKFEKDKYLNKLKSLASQEKKAGLSIETLSEKYGFSIEELEKPYF